MVKCRSSIGLLVAMLALGGSAGWVAPPLAAQSAGHALAPELRGLGTHTMAVTTSHRRAQAFFDQGLRLLYAFNHTEAQRAFQEAARIDRSLAMAHWGQALTWAPNLNAPMTTEHAQLAYQAVQRARDLSAPTSSRERALIEALVPRFAA